MVQHYDALNLGYTFKSQDYRVLTFKSTLYQYSHPGSTQIPAYEMNTKVISVTSNVKSQNIKVDFSTRRPAIQCNKCQSYRNAAVICPSPVKVTKVKEPP